jgi:hypothetical protein
MSSLAFLRRYVGARGAPGCELCAGPLHGDHRHVVDVEAHRILCACGSCAILFDGAVRRRYRAIPERIRAERRFAATDAWSKLGIPVGIAFCYHASHDDRWIAVLPGPAGATEAELDEDRWHEVCARSPMARTIEDDVEALLVRTRPSQAPQVFAAPIDRCYALAGIMRRSWKGFDGGSEARAAVDAFFDRLAAASEPFTERGTEAL